MGHEDIKKYRCFNMHFKKKSTQTTLLIPQLCTPIREKASTFSKITECVGSEEESIWERHISLMASSIDNI